MAVSVQCIISPIILGKGAIHTHSHTLLALGKSVFFSRYVFFCQNRREKIPLTKKYSFEKNTTTKWDALLTYALDFLFEILYCSVMGQSIEGLFFLGTLAIFLPIVLV